MCSAIVATAGYAADSQVTPVPAGINAPPFGPGEEQLIAPPSIAQHYDWYFRPDDTERNHPGFLAYEATDTDDQVLYFVCEEGGQRIFAGINSAHANIKTLTLTAADQTLHLNGKFDKSENARTAGVHLRGDSWPIPSDAGICRERNAEYAGRQRLRGQYGGQRGR